MTNPNGVSRQQPIGKLDRVIPFGKYLLLERVAVGGMAEVFMAKSFGVEGFEKVLAIKRILPTMAEDDEFIEMFIDEAKIAGQLSHANIAPIFELGKIGESHYIAMEYVWGKDLLQIMNRHRRLRKRMDPTMVAWIAARMCEALDYAHTKRDRHGVPLDIIHRDVSPQNILCSYEGEVKLIDFGIAKAASRTTRTQAGVLKGKFGYMSPEQVRGLPIDVRSDIFAVGTCMYEMLTSDRLFMGESDFSTLEKVRNADVAPIGTVVEEVPSALNDIVMKALERDVVDRWQSAAQLQEALQSYLVSQPPPFSASKLSTWLKTAFAAEMAKEKERMDAFSQMGRPAQPGSASRDAPFVSNDILEDDLTVDEGSLNTGSEAMNVEATVVNPSPFEEAEAGLPSLGLDSEEAWLDQPTQIFFSAENEHEAGPSPVPASPLEAFGSQDLQEIAPDYEIGELEEDASSPAVRTDGVHAGHKESQPPLGFVPVAPMESVPIEVVGKETSGASPRWIVLLTLTSLLMGGIGVAVALRVLGGDEMGIVRVSTAQDVSATVKIDNEVHGIAPVEVEVSAGEHLIEVVAEGYRPVSKPVVVQARSESSYDVLMEAVPEFAAPENPDGDATEREAAPIEDSQGEGEVHLAAPDPPQAETLEPTPESPAEEVRPSVAPEGEAVEAPEVRSADVSPPRPAEAAAASREPEEVPTSTQRPRPPRESRPEPRREPRAPQSGTTNPPEVSPARRFGSVSVNSIPYSRVFIDGADTGRDTPAMSIRVPVGTHRVLLRTADGRSHTRRVEVSAGETVNVVHRF